MAYGPNIPPMGSGVPHGAVPDVFFPRILAPNTPMVGNYVGGGMTNRVQEQIARTLRVFGFMTKGRARAYQKPYPDYFGVMPYPRGFRMPDFARFTGDDARTTYEHVG
jgi:hypothetical protein